jgi:Putative quorum-sensing-regulated virulence factor
MGTMENAGEFVMPFGKHRGAMLRDVPTSYVRWLARECNAHTVREHAVRFLHQRAPLVADAPPVAAPRTNREIAAEAFRRLHGTTGVRARIRAVGVEDMRGRWGGVRRSLAAGPRGEMAQMSMDGAWREDDEDAV